METNIFMWTKGLCSLLKEYSGVNSSLSLLLDGKEFKPLLGSKTTNLKTFWVRMKYMFAA